MSSRELTRSLPFQVVRAEGDDEPGDGLTLEGIAAVFDTPTRIDSWEGVFDEQIRKGAFRRTLNARTPRLQFDHGHHPLIGSIPIGVIEDARETDEGLFVSARLTDNWLVQPIRDAIADGAVDGMSFRFEVVKEEWRDSTGKLLRNEDEILQLLYRPDERGPLQRTLTEVKVPELGPVTWPAYQETSVSVRSREIAAAILGDYEATHAVRADLARAASGQSDIDQIAQHVKRAGHRDFADALRDPETQREVAELLLDGDSRTTHSPAAEQPTEVEPERMGDPLPEHSPDATDDPPDGHSSLSRNRIQAELARLNGRIDAAERHDAITQMRSARNG